MDKLTFMRLWDIYNGLLTPTQQEITDLYFNLDLTVSEIASEKGISRQGVSECLKICKNQLEEYENKLHFSKRLTDISLRVSAAAEQFKAAHPEFSENVDEFLAIFENDFSADISADLSDKD